MPGMRLDVSEGRSGQPEWKRGFDEVSNHGLTCLLCGAVVPSMPDLTERHRNWHTSLDGRLTGA